MKSILSLLIAGSLTSAPVLALNLDRQSVDDADQAAVNLSTFEELNLRTKLNWTRLILLEMKKNQGVFDLVHAHPNSPARYVIGMANTAVVGGLLAATTTLAVDQIKKDINGRKNVATNNKLIGEKTALANVEQELALLEHQVRTGTRPSTSEFSGIVRPQIETRIAVQKGNVKQTLTSLERKEMVTPIQRTARGFGLVLAAGLAVTLIQDIGVTWAQIVMDPNDVEQKKLDLEQFVRDGEQQLARNAQN